MGEGVEARGTWWRSCVLSRRGQRRWADAGMVISSALVIGLILVVDWDWCSEWSLDFLKGF
jgi:hypothetical protein